MFKLVLACNIDLFKGIYDFNTKSYDDFSFNL